MGKKSTVDELVLTLDLIFTRLQRIEQALLRIEKNVRPFEVTVTPEGNVMPTSRYFNDATPKFHNKTSVPSTSFFDSAYPERDQDGLF